VGMINVPWGSLGAWDRMGANDGHSGSCGCRKAEPEIEEDRDCRWGLSLVEESNL